MKTDKKTKRMKIIRRTICIEIKTSSENITLRTIDFQLIQIKSHRGKLTFQDVKKHIKY